MTENTVRTHFDKDQEARTLLERSNINSPTGKAGQIVREMEQRLILGYYRPGESLSFKMLADAFNVSRQPVSAAISHLRASGYVEVLPQVGCRVVKPSRTEIDDFFFVLSKIDGAVASLAAARHTEEEGRQLAMIRPPSEIDMLDDVLHRKAYISYIDRFHDQIWRMARSPLLQAQFYNLRNLSSFYLWQGLPKLAPSAALQLINERDDIAQAILNRDAAGAAAKMEKHILGKPDLAGVSG